MSNLAIETIKQESNERIASNFYRGYVKTGGKSGKEPTHKWRREDKDGFLFSLNEVRNTDSYGGVLSDDSLFVDIDEIEQAKILLQILDDLKIKTRVIQTTHGMHYLFKNTSTKKSDAIINKAWTKAIVACGLTCDFKVGAESNQQEVLKQFGKERPIIRECADEDIPVIPPFLLPVNLTQGAFDKAGLSWNKGQRNDSVFKFISYIKERGLSNEEITQSIKLLNNYVLEEPMPESEIKILLRDESINRKVSKTGKKTGAGNNKSKYYQIAEKISEKYPTKFIDGEFYIYILDSWKKSEHAINNVIKNEDSSIPPSAWNNVKQILISNAYEISIANKSSNDITSYYSSPNFIMFKNGIIDINNMENVDNIQVDDFDSKYFIPNMINIDVPVVDHFNRYDDKYAIARKFMEDISCGDKEIEMLLEEIIGSTFYRSNEIMQGTGAFFLLGSGADGKSTFIDVIRHILGVDNHRNLTLCDINSKFGISNLFQKNANLCDEANNLNNNAWKLDNANFRALVFGSPIEAEEKLANERIRFSSYAKMVFACNNVPNFNDTTDSMERRMTIIPFNGRFEKNGTADKDMLNKLKTKDSIEYFILVALEGILRVLKNKDFTKGEKIIQEKIIYREEKSVLDAFISQLSEDDYVNRHKEVVWHKFLDFCLAENEDIRKLEYGKPRVFNRMFLAKMPHIHIKDQVVDTISGGRKWGYILTKN